MRTVDLMVQKKIGFYDELSKWGHTAIVGKTGYGKGTLGQTLCEQAFEDGKKVLVWDMFRGENTMYCFPENNEAMMVKAWEKGESPKGFPLEVLLPVFAKEGMKEVEITVPEPWKPCKINFKNLTKSELLYLMGKTTEKAEQILDVIDFAKFKNLAELQIKFLQLESGQDRLLLYDGQGNSADIGDKRIYRTINRAIGALLTKNIVASDLSEGFCYIDLDEVQRNNKVITAITGLACGSVENFLTVFFNVMSGLIYDRQKHSGKYKPMVIYVPEVSNIAGATAQNSPVQNLMRVILQEARDAGIEVIIDTQRPQNIDASVKGQITKWYIFNLNKDDADYMDKNLVEIPHDYEILYRIPDQGIGICVKLWQDSHYRWRFRKAAFIRPPRSHKKMAYENINFFYEGMASGLKSLVDRTGHKIKVGFQSSEVPGDLFSEAMKHGG